MGRSHQNAKSHIFVTKKRTGELKARQVAGGNKQRDFISKEVSSSPTASNNSIDISSLLDAIEGREVVTVDIMKDSKRRKVVVMKGQVTTSKMES